MINGIMLVRRRAHEKNIQGGGFMFRVFQKSYICIFIISIIIMMCNIGCKSEVHKEEVTPWPAYVEISYQDGKNLILSNSITGGTEIERIGVAQIDLNEKSISQDQRNYDWGPNGGEIAYSYEERIYIISRSEDKKSLVNGEVPRYPPDGKLIAYLEKMPSSELGTTESGANKGEEDGLKKLMVIDLQNLKASEVAIGEIYSFDWAYGGRDITYACSNSPEKEKEQKALMYNVSTGENTVLFDLNDAGYYWIIKCAPNTPLVAFGRRGGKDHVGLSVYDYEKHAFSDIYKKGAVMEVVWSPDGEKIAMVVNKSSQEYPNNDIVIIDQSANELALLPTDDLGFNGIDGRNFNIAWSPDGKRLIFARQYKIKPSAPDIYCWTPSFDLNNLREDDLKRITYEGANYYPRWNPSRFYK